MKRTILLTIAGATLIAYYLLKKKRAKVNVPEKLQAKPIIKHHLTTAFVNAKKHAVH